MTCTSWHGFRRCAATTHAAVIIALRLNRDSPKSGLRETSQDDFPCPLILVTNGERENLRYLGPIRVIDVVFVDEVKRRLAQVLTSVALTDGRVRLRAAIQRREMHLTLKRALLKLVDLPLPDPGRDPTAGRRFPRTAEDLATLVDLTTDYLRRLAMDARLPLGRIMHRHVALRALEMFAVGVSAELVAERLGYESTRGVHGLITRNFEMNATEVLKCGLHQFYAETAALIVAPAFATSPHGST